MRSYFFNAKPTTDFEKHPTGFDRAYDAVDYNLVMGTFFHNGVFANLNPDACKAVADGLTITFIPGVALINGGQAHFEPEDTVELLGEDGHYSVMCRKNNASEVRDFELVALKGADYPAPVREGDIYDLCLAHVLVQGGAATVTDTRSNREICGFAAVAGQPPYQPPTGVPSIVWDYTLFPEQMTEEQRQIVENTPSLMEMFQESRPKADWFTKEETLAPETAALYDGANAPNEAFRLLAPPKLIVSYKTVGAITWQNTTGAKKILVVMIAGGGGGNAYSGYTGGNTPIPGASGVVDFFVLDVTNNQTINGIVGAGGLGKRYSGAAMTRDCTDGGTTSFGGKTVDGGQKGKTIPSSGSNDWNTHGGQSPGPSFAGPSSITRLTFYCFGRYVTYGGGSTPSVSLSQEKMLTLLSLISPMDLPFCMATSPALIMANTSLDRAILPNGNLTASCHNVTTQTGDYISEKGTDPGCGGGYSNKFASSPSGLVYGSDGCDGGIFIYDISGRGA